MEHNMDRTINSEPTASHTTREDKDDTIGMQGLINKKGVPENLDYTVFGENINDNAIAKDIVRIIVGENVVNDKAIADYDCGKAAESLTGKEIITKDNDYTIIDPVISEKSSLSSHNKNSSINNNTKDNKQKKRSKDTVEICIEPTPVIIEEDSEKANDCTISYNVNINFPTFVSDKTITKDKCCTFVPNTLANEKDLAKVRDCIVVAETCNQKAKENTEDCTINAFVNSDKSSPRSTHSGNGINKNSKENNQLIDLVDDVIEPTPIIIDVEAEKDNDCTILDNDNDNLQENGSKHSNNKVNTSHQTNIFGKDDVFFKDNKLMIDLIEKCLDMENSTRMLRVINKTLIPAYKDADVKYKQSTIFEKAILYTMKKLDTAPDTKFSHIKALIELLKESKVKKRSSLVTLKRNLNGQFSKKGNIYFRNHIPSKKSKVDIIDLADDEDDDEIFIEHSSDTNIQMSNVGQVVKAKSLSELDDSDYEPHVEFNDTDNDSDVQINEETEDEDKDKDQNEDIILIDDENAYSNKENKISTNNSKTVKIPKVISLAPSANKEKEMVDFSNYVTEAIDLCNEETNEIGNNSNKVFNPGDVSNRICELELQIAAHNNVIKELDEAEITDDDETSPYLQSEYYKQRVVILYKELCKLTGSEAVKRHKVKLSVVEDHHPGPVKCLEEFINNNIDEHGDPPFPDLCDVMSCVRRANTIYNMGWTARQIGSEARTLLIQYGRTVKKRRQKREWKHLMHYVKEEVADPAAEDPMLEARLVENDVIAKRNEDELINRYVQMENAQSKYDTMRVEVDESDHDDDDDTGYGSTSNMPSVSNLSATAKSVDRDHTYAMPSVSNFSTTAKTVDSEQLISLNTYKKCSTSSTSVNITNNVAIYNSTNVHVLTQNSYIGPVCNLNENILTATYVTGTENNDEAIFSNHETCGANYVVHTQPNLDEKSNFEVPLSIMPQVIEHIKPASEVATPIINSLPALNNVSSLSNDINIDEVSTNFESYIPVNSVLFNKDTSKAIDSSEATGTLEVCGGSKTHTVDSAGAVSPQTDVNDILSLKQEPLDIPYMLNQLGDNYTATIIDIEDPFMVIEISDSSESEDDGIQ